VDGGVSAIVENVSCGEIISVTFCTKITKRMVIYAVEGWTGGCCCGPRVLQKVGACWRANAEPLRINFEPETSVYLPRVLTPRRARTFLVKLHI
jgi:hypothetical protein